MTTIAEMDETAPSHRRRRSARLTSVKLWALLALLFSGVLAGVGDRSGSPLWFLDPLLVGGFLIGVWRGRPWRTRLAGRRAAVAFVVLAWLTGMLYELTLSDQGSTFGGLADRTGLSFALAQAWYLPFALIGLFLVRRYRYDFREVFFAGAAASALEVVVAGLLPGVVASPLFVLSPLVLAYYGTVYGMLLAWPLLLVDERSLWAPSARQISPRRKIAYGAAAGLACWLCFAGWAAVLDLIAPGFVS